MQQWRRRRRTVIPFSGEVRGQATLRGVSDFIEQPRRRRLPETFCGRKSNNSCGAPSRPISPYVECASPTRRTVSSARLGCALREAVGKLRIGDRPRPHCALRISFFSFCARVCVCARGRSPARGGVFGERAWILGASVVCLSKWLRRKKGAALRDSDFGQGRLHQRRQRPGFFNSAETSSRHDSDTALGVGDL